MSDRMTLPQEAANVRKAKQTRTPTRGPPGSSVPNVCSSRDEPISAMGCKNMPANPRPWIQERSGIPKLNLKRLSGGMSCAFGLAPLGKKVTRKNNTGFEYILLETAHVVENWPMFGLSAESLLISMTRARITDRILVGATRNSLT